MAPRMFRSFLLAALLLFSFSGLVRAGPFRYEIELDAPERYKTMLQQNLEIYRWRDNPRMNTDQLRRLFKRTPDEIRELISTEGFFSPRIESGLAEKSGGWVARFSVAPGEPARVSSLALRVEEPFADGSSENAARLTKIQEQWPLNPGAVFRQQDWEAAKRGALQKLLIERYPSAGISFSQATVDPETNQVALEVAIDSGPAFTFGGLELSGLKRYPRSIVERLSTVEPGAPYAQSKLLDFQQRLQDSLYFSSALVTAETDPAHPERVPVRVEVTENPSRKLGFGVGASTNTGARAQIDYRDLNFFDRAWRLSSTLKLETKKQGLNGEVQFPLTEAGYRDSINALLESTDIEGEVTRKIGFGAKRSRITGKIETALAMQYQAERQEVSGVESKLNKALTLNYSWTKRDVDNLLYPTRGYLFNAQIGGGAKALLSDQDFGRGYGRLVYFHPLGARDSLILRVEAGMVAAASRAGIPSGFLFRAGGDQSVRGYAYQSLGLKQGAAVVGGRYLGVASAEYVHWVMPKWGAALFFDAGNAVDEVKEFKAVQGYGAGMRWKSPVGPLNLDIAYGRDVEQIRMHFSVGFTF